MKIAVLETGVPPDPLADEFGSYPDMFARLLGPAYTFETFDVEKGDLPDLAAHDAYLITGSPAGVYEPLPWIAPLLEFIRSASQAKMIGVCFGHQAMAQALGGEVIKSRQGLGRGPATLRRRSPAALDQWRARGGDTGFAPGPGGGAAAGH